MRRAAGANSSALLVGATVVLLDGHPLARDHRHPAREPPRRHAAHEHRLLPDVQQPPPAQRPLDPASVHVRPGGGQQPPARTVALHPAQPCAGRARVASGGLAMVEPSRRARPRTVAGVARVRLADRPPRSRRALPRFVAEGMAEPGTQWAPGSDPTPTPPRPEARTA